MTTKDSRATVPAGKEATTLAGGCFWCLEAVYDRMKGVEAVESGYMGGQAPNPTYEQICTGRTGHAEVVRITFDPKIMGGRACIRGLRIPVSVIVGQVAHGATFEEILQGYPDLERADIQQALEYAVWLTREEVRTT